MSQRPANARQLDAAYYHQLWLQLFDEGRIAAVLPPDEQLWQQDLGRSLQIMMGWLGNLAGQRVLELGCGPGDYTLLLARRGAQVTAIDIAPASLAVTARRAAANGLRDRLRLGLMAAEVLACPSGCFDLVVGFGLLHHAVPHQLAAEVRRVLRPGGRALFREPLGMNPLLHLAREYLPYRDKRRSLNEHPLTYDDIALVGRQFEAYRVQELYLLSMISRAVGGERSFPALWQLDQLLLRHLPATRRWCRYVLLEYTA